MYPAYRWTDSYPHHPTPMHFAPSNDPRANETPSLMKIEPNTLNLPHHPWPYGSNYCHPIPQGYHSCCNHSYLGSPYFTSPYPHYPPPPPPPFHSHEFYPPFPGAYPAYSVPPPHYSIEQPKYDYDKNTHAPQAHHCCGCNHQEDEKKSRIIQEEPVIDKKTSDYLVPLLKDCPFPIVWVPPSYTNTESNAKEKENEKPSHDPVSLEPLKQRGNGEMIKDQESENGNRFPFPIFWLPSKSNEVGKDIKKENLDLAAEKVSDSEAEPEKSSKPSVQKVIPVKQLEIKEEKKIPEKTDNGKEGKASPKTSSKLPPVCLRIDPLPKKKSNSRSRSLSPPGDKERSKGSTIEDSKSAKQQPESIKKINKEQTGETFKPINVTSDAKKVEKDSLVDPNENIPKGEKNESEKGTVQDFSSKAEPSKMEKKKRLSEDEAVLMIQSAYRGFEVRKSQPLMKLKQIAEVGKRMVELRNRVQGLESIDEKQKLVIGETIMSLLLKLDTIQGLHPIVRDVRKSVAKELVGLQEKLDSLKSVKPKTPTSEDNQTQPQSDIERPEVDSIQKAGESEDDLNHEPQVEQSTFKMLGTASEETSSEDDVIEKSDQTEPQSDDKSLAVDSIQKSVESQEDINVETQVEQNVETPSEETSSEDDVIEKSDQTEPQSDDKSLEVDSIQSTCENEETPSEETTSEGDVIEKSDETQPQPDSKNHESEDNYGAEDCKTDLEPHVELQNEEVDNNQIQTLVDGCIDQQQAESVEEHEVRCTNCVHETEELVEPNNNQLQMVEKDKTDQTETPSEDDHVKAQNEELNKNQIQTCLDDVIQTQVEVDTCEHHEKVEFVESQDIKVEKDNGEGLKGGDRKLLEENEKLRVAVEELMKAGNEQVSVIKELNGRVKDLEKKLLKKKTRKVKKFRRSRGSVVEQELKSCVV